MPAVKAEQYYILARTSRDYDAATSAAADPRPSASVMAQAAAMTAQANAGR